MCPRVCPRRFGSLLSHCRDHRQRLLSPTEEKVECQQVQHSFPFEINVFFAIFHRTGLVGFAMLGLTFIPTVISIFSPGSPFELSLGVNQHLILYQVYHPVDF